MTDFYPRHQATLERALEAISTRRYWSPYPESPRSYPEEMPTQGDAAFEARRGRSFEFDGHPGQGTTAGDESSPYGLALAITYPQVTPAELLDAAATALPGWSAASPQQRAGICLEILHRLSRRSFEMAHAVMQTTGQAFLMAFQAGGPHALDRGLEAVAYGYRELTRLPGPMRWEKPQGKRDPLLVDKHWRIRPRGVAVAIGVSTFPTWNGYPGIFASLVTGNPVIVKPHPATVLPLALFVETARAVLTDAGHEPNVVTLAVDTAAEPIAKELVMDRRVGIVDYTGGPEFGTWLEDNVRHALVFTEKAGVNSVVVDSTDDLKGLYRNLSVSMSLFSGQMCTTPQNVFVPAGGIETGDGHLSFDDFATGLAAAIEGLLSDDGRAGDLLGAIKAEGTLRRLDRSGDGGTTLLEPRTVTNPTFPDAVIRTPRLVRVDAADQAVYMREMFGPVGYVVATEGTAESLELAGTAARDHGAITWLVYTTDDEVRARAEDAAVDAGVAVAFNLTGGLFVNQTAAFSDFHVTGANPAGNASLTDPAFVAGRFRVVGVRTPA
ncbi:MAG: phenylacetic acid degradation protein PaaN [Acidimicrobiia bacterium]|nr:phenylacetic acid degradation protein PaaN [Acidimicrobiia bacterium]